MRFANKPEWRLESKPYGAIWLIHVDELNHLMARRFMVSTRSFSSSARCKSFWPRNGAKRLARQHELPFLCTEQSSG